MKIFLRTLVILSIALAGLSGLPTSQASAPSMPYILSPQRLESVHGWVDFRWTASTDPDGGSVSYVVRGAREGDPFRDLCPGTPGLRTEQTSCRLYLDSYPDTYGFYNFYIHVMDSQGEVYASDSSAFYFGPNQPPSIPSDPTPHDGATNVARRPVLSWTSSDPDGDTMDHTVWLRINGGNWFRPCYMEPEPRCDLNNRYLLPNSARIEWTAESWDPYIGYYGPTWTFTVGPPCTTVLGIALPFPQGCAA